MKAAQVVYEGETLSFFFPSIFSDTSIIDAVKYIKFHSGPRWERKLLEQEISVKEGSLEQFKHVLIGEFKYIASYIKDEPTNIKCMLVFSKKINHDDMWERLSDAIYENDLLYDSLFSAGFVNNGNCFGRSESLDIESHKDDSEIYRTTFT